MLLHGAGASHLIWPPELRRRAGWDTYSVDLAGHGDSGGPVPATIGSHVDHLLDWMRSADLGQVVLAGHSMGAAIALATALRDPVSVRALVLLGVTARMQVNPDLLAMTGRPADQAAAYDRVVDLQFSQSAAPDLVQLVRERGEKWALTALHNDFLACHRFDVQARLEEITCPALVVSGEADRMTPLDACRALADGLPNARFRIVLYAGHLVMLERPAIVAGLLAEFLGLVSRDRDALD